MTIGTTPGPVGGGRSAADRTVLAQPAPSVSIRRHWWAENVWSSLWFLPTATAIVAFVLARVTVEIDRSAGLREAPTLLMPGDLGAVAAGAATIAAAMLTFLAVVFSTTLIAIQLAGSQYSPRLVRVFVRSPVTQTTLSVFLATFVFALNAVFAVRSGPRGTAPVVTISITYVLVVATTISFVVLLHRIVRLLRVQYLFLSVSRAAQRVLEAEYPPASVYVESPAPAPGASVTVVQYEGRPGVIQAVDVAGLAGIAADFDGWIEMLVAVGENVGYATALARLHADGSPDVADAIQRRCLIGGERTHLQDVAFGFRQLVDSASRALSPAINDPTTAVQALHRVVDLLARIADRPDPTGWYTDAGGVVRVRLLEDGFARLAILGFTEILRYGADAPQVTRALRAAYDELDAVVSEDRRPVIAQLRLDWERAVREVMPPAFAEVASQADRLGMG